MIIFVGPVFFYLLKIALQHGVIAGTMVSIGIILSDIVYVGCCLWGAKKWLQNDQVQFWIAIIGGLILIIMGIKYFLHPPLNMEIKSKINPKNAFGFLLQGFLINFANPFVLLVWLSVVAAASSKYHTDIALTNYLIGTLLGIFTLDISKVFLANKLKQLIQPLWLKKLFKAVGIVLIGFGIWLIIFGLSN